MKFCFNDFILALSFALDFIEIDLLGVNSNHSKRVAYLVAQIAMKLGYEGQELFDLIAIGLLHDVGRCKNWLSDDFFTADEMRRRQFDADHCRDGEIIIQRLLLETDCKNVIYYHHERYDGSGMYGLKGADIPIKSQIVALADSIEKNFPLQDVSSVSLKPKVIEFVKRESGTGFNPLVAEAFLEANKQILFWIELRDDNIDTGLRRVTPNYFNELEWREIRNKTEILSNIIDMKSSFTKNHSRELAEKTEVMADYYEFDEDSKYQMLIAADLHDLGKLVVSNSILHKPKGLELEEFYKIQEHSYYTRKCLQQLDGFENITEWAANHHEKLNGKGYPFGKSAEELDFNSRLLMCLDIYQALVEDRPYRSPMSHERAISILKGMAERGEIDENIVRDIDTAFENQ